MRYIPGHKVIQFEANDAEFRSVVLVHTHRDEIRISRASSRRL